ncbi:16S rRNA (guanine(966)-N(2))-methyltransferase RsmD [Akkermansiaceae bacterium]|nr:16S rRNA (guanine(966)-N(2))-methyltransferase RsmD [Akkermansiaceae bacterium]
MRIIAGKAKGHSLRVPRDVARPSTDRVRESVFGVLMERLPEAKALDLFAGSGALGLEALSRGAASCVFIEKDRHAVKTITDNLKKTRLEGGTVIHREVEDYLKTERNSYDLIFADPPYADGISDLVGDLLDLDGWSDWLADGGLLILEKEARGENPLVHGLKLLREKDYGKSRILIYQRAD